jgi:hypothetical protein
MCSSLNTNAKFTDKETGRSIFVDAEGTLGLSKNEVVPAIFGIYRFNKKTRHIVQLHSDRSRSNTL